MCTRFLCYLKNISVMCFFLMTIITTADTENSSETNNDSNLDLSFPNCGLRSPKLSEGKSRKKRLIGGHDAEPNSWPWMTSLLGKGDFRCGGALISRRYVLTAAHCFDFEQKDISASDFWVVFGSHTPKDGIIYPVETITRHPDYTINELHHDIALLKVKAEVVLDKTVYPVCLPPVDMKINLESKVVTIIGWGLIKHEGELSKVLQEQTFPVVSTEKCNATYYGTADAPNGVGDEVICAGYKESGKATCQGDSGGPMMIEMADGHWLEMALVSFGPDICDTPDHPTVGTNILHHTEWIYKNTDLSQK